MYVMPTTVRYANRATSASHTTRRGMCFTAALPEQAAQDAPQRQGHKHGTRYYDYRGKGIVSIPVIEAVVGGVDFKRCIHKANYTTRGNSPKVGMC